MQLLIAMAILGIVWLGIRKMATANPKTLKSNLRKVGGVAAVGLGVILTLRGALPIAIPVFLFGLGLLGLGHLAGIELPWQQRRTRPASHVRTAMLELHLGRDLSDIDGTVLNGKFAGRRLSNLSLDELASLHGECSAAGDHSAQLLEAFLDTRHPQWQAGFGGKSGSGGAGGRPLDRAEALAILGLEEGATQRQIKSAHRTLMKKYHPDQGGSDYLAARINEAKELLLG